jgi:uracil-DNA glycosylase
MNIIIDNIKNNVTTDWSTILCDKAFIDTYKLNDTYNKISHLLLTGQECVDYYPKSINIFRCFNMFNVKDLKIVLIGQDPYHTSDKYGTPYADGLSFSFNKDLVNTASKYSLGNIFKELNNEYGILRKSTSLCDWASQGVLLLNTIMTVRPKSPKSHSKIYGWEHFTDSVIRYIDTNCNGVDFILLGKESEKKKLLINNKKNNVVIAGHPSPLNKSGTFLGSGCFSKCINSIKWV